MIQVVSIFIVIRWIIYRFLSTYWPSCDIFNASFKPPAIKSTELWYTVVRCFHTRRSWSFKWSTWCVKPYIWSSCHYFTNSHIVVVDEGYFYFAVCWFHNIVDVLNRILTRVIFRMCFSSINYLNRSYFFGNIYQPFWIWY